MATSKEELEEALLAQNFRPNIENPGSGRSNPYVQLLKSGITGQPIPEPEVIPEPNPDEPIIKEREDVDGLSYKELIRKNFEKNPNYIEGIDNPYLTGDLEIPEEKTPDSSNPFTTAVRGVSRGFAQTYITAAQGILAIADSATDAIGFEDAIDSEDGEIIRLLQEAREYIGHEEGMGGKLAEAIGSMLSLAVPGIGQAKFAGKAAAAAMKGEQGLKIAQQANRYAKGMSALKYTTAGGIGSGTSDEMLKAYKQAGGEYTTGQKNLALAMGLGIGFSELLPIEMILKGLPRYLDNNIKNGIIRRITNAVADGGMEGVQEVGASLAQEYSAQMIYNPDQEIGESMLSDFGYGGGAGAIFSLFLRGKNRKIGRTKKDQKTLKDDYDNATPSEPIEENELPIGKEISLFDNEGEQTSGTVKNVNPKNNTAEIIVTDGDRERVITVPLTPEVNNEGYSLFSDEDLFNPKNSLDIADKDGNVMNYPVGNPEKTSNELLEKEENRLNKLASTAKISMEDIFKLKVIRSELARREALTSDTISDPEQIDTEMNQEAAADEEAQTGSSKFIEDVDDLTNRTIEEAEVEAEERARQEGLNIETGEFIPIPKKYNNNTFDIPDPDSNVAYNTGKKGKNPESKEIINTAKQYDLTEKQFKSYSKAYAEDVQEEVNNKDKTEDDYKIPSFKDWIDVNFSPKIRNNVIENEKKELNISNKVYQNLIDVITKQQGKDLDSLNAKQRQELRVSMAEEQKKQQKRKKIKSQPKVNVVSTMNQDGDTITLEVKGRTDTKETDALEVVSIALDEDVDAQINQLKEKYNIEKKDIKQLKKISNVVNSLKEAGEINPTRNQNYFKALQIATKNKTITTAELQQQLFGTGIENANDFQSAENLLKDFERQEYIEAPKDTVSPTTKRKVLQKFTSVDTAGEILIREVEEEGGVLQDLTEDQVNVANKVKNIIETIAPGSKLKLAHIVKDAQNKGRRILGAQFKDIITVSLDARAEDVMSPTYHEATHYLWNNGFFNEEQRKILLDNRDYLRQLVKDNIITDPLQYNAVFSNLDEAGEMDELIAYTSGYYNASMELTNNPPSFITGEINGILDTLYEMFKQLAQYVTGNNQLFTPTELKEITNILDSIRNGSIGNQFPSFNVDNPNPLARRQAVITGLPDAKYEVDNFSLFSPLKKYLNETQLKQKKKGSEWLSRSEKGTIIGALKKAKYKEKGREFSVTDNELKETGLYNYLIKNPNEIITGQALLNIAKQNESLMIVNVIGEPTNDINYTEVALQEGITLQLKRNLYNFMVTEQPVEILYALHEASQSGAFNNNVLTDMLKKYTNSNGELINGRKVKNYNLKEVAEDILNFNLNTNIKVDEVIDRWFNANTQLNKYIGDAIAIRELEDQYSEKEVYDDPYVLEMDPDDINEFENEQKQKTARIVGIKLLTNTGLLKPQGTDTLFLANKLMKDYGYNDEFLMSFVDTLKSTAKTKRIKSEYTNSKIEESLKNMGRTVSAGDRAESYKAFTFPGIRGLGIDNYQTFVFSLPNFNQEAREYSNPEDEIFGEYDGVDFSKGKIVGKNANIKSLGGANHFDNIANPFGYVRVTDMITEDGQKILIVEEIQSDYASYVRDKLILHLEAQIKIAEENQELSKLSWFPNDKKLLINETYREDYLSEAPQEARTNIDREIRNIARKATLSDISGTQVELKKFLKAENLPELPYLNQNDYLSFGVNYLIQHASRNGYDGIAVTNAELQQERYRHNFKNSIKGITFDRVILENLDSKEPNKEAVRFSYTIPSKTNPKAYQENDSILFLNETDLDINNYDLTREFQNNESFNFDSKMTFEKFLGKEIAGILLTVDNTMAKSPTGMEGVRQVGQSNTGGVYEIENLPAFIERNALMLRGRTIIDGIDVTGRKDIPVGGAEFRKTYNEIIPKLFIDEMKASVPAQKRKTFAKEKKYLYTEGQTGQGKIINENEILNQPTITANIREAQVMQASEDLDTLTDRITSNVTNALRFIPITEEMRLESKDAPALNSVGKARRMAVINEAKKERHDLSSNIRERVANFFTDSKIFNPLYGVPQKREYLLKRGKAMGIFSASERIALKLRKDVAPYLDKNNPLKKKDHKQVRELLFKYLSTSPKDGELELYKQLKLIDPKMAKAALDSKDIIEKLGQQLLEANIIPADSFEMNKRSYLPRLYIEHVLKNPAGDARSYAKKRKEDAADSLTVIDELAPEFLVSRAIQRPMRDLAMLEFYNSIAGNRQWVLDGDLADVEYDGKKISFFWLGSQAKQYREIAKYLNRDPERKAKMLKEADDMQIAADKGAAIYAKEYDLDVNTIFDQEHKESRFSAPDGFKRVPNNKLYGLMAGKAVRTGIYEDIISSISYSAWGDNNYVKGGKLARKLTSTWKLIKVPLNPPTVFRNMMSNAILMNLSGMPIRRIMSNMYKATNEMIAYKKGDMANSKHYKALLDRGVADTSFTEAELFRWAEDFKEFTTERSINELGILSWMHLKGWRRFASAASSVYQGIEVMGKTAMAIEMMENQNKNADEAYLIANDALFDYSLVPPVVRGLRTSPIGIPFLTFMYKVIPKLIDVALNNPFRFAPYVAMGYALPQIFMHMFDIDDDEYEKLLALLPQYTNAGTTFPLPIRDDAGRLQFLDFGYIMPWGFINQLLESGEKGYNTIKGTAQLEEFKANDILQTLGLFGGPGWSLAGLPLNIDPFSKRPIWKEGEPFITDTGSDFNISIPGIFKKDGQLIDFMQYMTNQFMLPSFLHTEYGATNRMISAINEAGEINDKNRLTTTQAAIKFVGLNTFAIDEKQAGYTRLMLLKEVNLITAERKKMLQNQSYSREDKLIRAEKYDEEIQKIKFKLALVNEITKINPDLLRTIRDKN